LKINNSEKELKNQKEEIVAVRDFSDIAKKNVYGGEFTYPNSGNTVLETGPIIENMFKVFKHINGNPDLVFSDESLNAAKYVIEIEPRFPFSYYAVARILRHRKDKEWKDYAEQAIAILEKTTKIKKHSDHHRQVLEQLNGFLSE
jgi:predicted ATP-grasp superfamily ATP-dependent carboligase